MLSRRKILALAAVVPVTYIIPGQTIPSDPGISNETIRAEKAEAALQTQITTLAAQLAALVTPGIQLVLVAIAGIGSVRLSWT